VPTRDEIKPKVIDKIASVVHRKPETIEEKDRLFEDLGMGPTVRKAMAMPYTKISEEFRGSPVTQSDAGNLKTVAASIDLVTKAANDKRESGEV